MTEKALNFNKIIYRKASIKDNFELKKLAIEVIKKNYISFLGENNVNYFIESGLSDNEIDNNIQNMAVCEYEGELIGLCVTLDDLLHLIMIKYCYQGKGIGKKFINYVENKMFKEFNSIRLESFEKNISTCEFYKKRGYKIVKKEFSENINDYILKFQKNIIR